MKAHEESLRNAKLQDPAIETAEQDLESQLRADLFKRIRTKYKYFKQLISVVAEHQTLMMEEAERLKKQDQQASHCIEKEKDDKSQSQKKREHKKSSKDNDKLIRDETFADIEAIIERGSE